MRTLAIILILIPLTYIRADPPPFGDPLPPCDFSRGDGNGEVNCEIESAPNIDPPPIQGGHPATRVHYFDYSGQPPGNRLHYRAVLDISALSLIGNERFQFMDLVSQPGQLSWGLGVWIDQRDRASRPSLSVDIIGASAVSELRKFDVFRQYDCVAIEMMWTLEPARFTMGFKPHQCGTYPDRMSEQAYRVVRIDKSASPEILALGHVTYIASPEQGPRGRILQSIWDWY